MNPTPEFGQENNQLQHVQANAIESIQRAEIDVQITTAKRYPRQLTQVKQSMLSFATLDQETAESCFYTLPRGGKNIQGPSVRLAEIALSCYGNIRAGSRVIHAVVDGPNPHVVIQSVCHDLEKNIAVTIEKRRRITKKKSKDFIDEDDINLAANAGAAIAFRDAVFKVVPLALVKPVYEQAKRVAIGDAKTLVDRRARMVETFGKMGVSKEMILNRLEKKSLEEVDLSDMETLIGLHTAIRDGDTTIDESFPVPVVKEKPTFDKTPGKPAAAPAGAPAAAAPSGPPPARAAAQTAQAKAKPAPAPAPAPEPAAEPEPEPQQSEEATEAEAGLAPAQEAELVEEHADEYEMPAQAAAPAAAKPPIAPKKAPKAAAAPPPTPLTPRQMLETAGVPVDDFTDWLVSTGRNKDAKVWTTYDAVTPAFWAALSRDVVGIGKCVRLYGTIEAPAAPVPAAAAE